MNAEKKPNAFKRALSTSGGKNSFITMIGCMVVLFAFTYFIPKGSYTQTALMISGVFSFIACQQFGKVISQIMAEDRKQNQKKSK